MREIKFRAWDEKEKEMLHWDKWHQEILEAIPIDCGDEWTDRCEVMQYTGLKDKNGKEIYEGDIVNFAQSKWFCDCNEEGQELSPIDKFCPACGRKIKEGENVTKSKIVFEEGAFCFEYENKEYSDEWSKCIWSIYLAERYILWFEKIGNIHENPELLK